MTGLRQREPATKTANYWTLPMTRRASSVFLTSAETVCIPVCHVTATSSGTAGVTHTRLMIVTSWQPAGLAMTGSIREKLRARKRRMRSMRAGSDINSGFGRRGK